jgi:hypothetical protein
VAFSVHLCFSQRLTRQRCVQLLGVDPLQAGNVVQLLVVLGMTVGWISTYMFRVANKDMTYAQRLREASHGGETSRSSSTSPLLSLVAAFELWHLMIALRASCLLLVFAETPGESVGG